MRYRVYLVGKYYTAQHKPFFLWKNIPDIAQSTNPHTVQNDLVKYIKLRKANAEKLTWWEGTEEDVA